jgi:hypothetical protein
MLVNLIRGSPSIHLATSTRYVTLFRPPDGSPVVGFLDLSKVVTGASSRRLHLVGFPLTESQDTVTATGQQIAYTPVDNSKGFWMFDSSTYSINGQSATQSGNKAVADTGTTLMLCSDTFVDAVYQAIPGATYDSQSQGYIFPANTTADQLPVVTVAVGDNQYTIQKEDLAFSDAGNGMVYGGIQSRGDMTFDILGDVFLKAIYAVSIAYPEAPQGLFS